MSVTNGWAKRCLDLHRLGTGRKEKENRHDSEGDGLDLELQKENHPKCR